MSAAEKKAPETEAGGAKCESCGKSVGYLKQVDSQMVCSDCSRNLKRQKFKERYERSREAAERKVIQQLFQKRIQHAKAGKNHFKKREFKKALQEYHSYLDILGRSLETEKTQIKPDQIQLPGEQLLLASIFWDMSRMYDRDPRGDEQLKIYIGSFERFSLGFPWQRAYKKNIAYYLNWGAPKHKEIFREVGKKYGARADKCVIASVVFHPRAAETESLRAFRDKHLENNAPGRAMVDFYYGFGPKLIPILRKSSFLQKSIRFLLRLFIQLLRRFD
jgi:hypothetical protein